MGLLSTGGVCGVGKMGDGREEGMWCGKRGLDEVCVN